MGLSGVELGELRLSRIERVGVGLSWIDWVRVQSSAVG